MCHGEASLVYRQSTGRKPRLTKTQKQRLSELVQAGPQAAGFTSACWTSLLIQQLIQREFGVLYDRYYVCQLLRNLGFSVQKARFVSDHLDEEARQRWWEETWPQIKRLAKEKKALILFGDEVSFAQWGSLGYTWALKGETPVVKTAGKRKGYKVWGLIELFSGFTTGHFSPGVASEMPQGSAGTHPGNDQASQGPVGKDSNRSGQFDE